MWYGRAVGGHGVDGLRQLLTTQQCCGATETITNLLKSNVECRRTLFDVGGLRTVMAGGVVDLIRMVEFLRRNYVDRSNIYGTFAVVTDRSKRKVTDPVVWTLSLQDPRHS